MAAAAAASAAGAERCLDRTHAADCTACYPAPPASDVHRIQLHGAAGPRAGEQRLRHLLLSCPEWNDSEARERLAQVLEGEGDADSAAVLRTRNAPALRKNSMIALARGWNYKSDVFVLKRRAAREIDLLSRQGTKRQQLADGSRPEPPPGLPVKAARTAPGGAARGAGAAAAAAAPAAAEEEAGGEAVAEEAPAAEDGGAYADPHAPWAAPLGSSLNAAAHDLGNLGWLPDPPYSN